MEVRVKLFATLQKYAPDGVKVGEAFTVTLPEKSRIVDLMGKLGMPPAEVKVAYVDGRARAEVYRLKGGEEVGFFPPVGGG